MILALYNEMYIFSSDFNYKPYPDFVRKIQSGSKKRLISGRSDYDFSPL